MKNRLLFLFAMSCLLAGVSQAQERNRLESWYMNWGLGYPVIKYPNDIDQTLNLLEALGVDNVSVMLDLLGFYWPVGEQTILGGIINGWGDRYSYQGDYLQLNAYIFSFSAMHFLQNRIGDGFFLRGDIGPARLVASGTGSENVTSDWGFGVLVGGGYGIPVSRETRILIHLNYSVRRIESEQISNFGIALSGMF